MYVYRFKDIRGEIIYIGRTNNIVRRIRTDHFGNKGHLSEECYRDTVEVEYAELKSENDSKVYELYLIDKHKPKYNNQSIGGGEISFDMPELRWIKADFSKDKKIRLTKKELEEKINKFAEEVKKECELMSNDLREKDNVDWLQKLDNDEVNEYLKTIYSMDRFINGITDIKDTIMEDIK